MFIIGEKFFMSGEKRRYFILKVLPILAIAVVMLIPSIYACIFLGSMWDPYGNIEDLPVAVVNQDEKVRYNGKTLQIGNDLVEKLKENKSLKFNFVDEETAEQGIENGTYYMVINIPKDFSDSATTLMTENPKKMSLQYDTNPGKNYIASKMSSTAIEKIKEEIENQVTQTYIQTVFDSIGETGDSLYTAVDGTAQLNRGADKLIAGNSEISKNLRTMADSTGVFQNGARTLSNGITTYTNGVTAVHNGVGKLYAGTNQLNSKVPVLARGITAIADGSGTLKNGLAEYLGGTQTIYTGAKQINKNSSALNSGISTLYTGSNTFLTGLRTYTGGVGSANRGAKFLTNNSSTLRKGANDLFTGADTFDTALKTYTDGVDTANDGAQLLTKNSSALNQGALSVSSASSQMSSGSSSLKSGVEEMSNKLGETVKEENEKQLSQLSSGLTVLDNGIQELDKAMEDAGESSLETDLTAVGTDIYTAGQGLKTVGAGAKTLSDAINSIKGESWFKSLDSGTQKKIISSLENSANQIASGLANSQDSITSASSHMSNASASAREVGKSVDSIKENVGKISSNSKNLLPTASQQITALYGGLKTVKTNLDQQLIPGITELDGGASLLMAGTNELQTGLSEYTAGVDTLAQGTNQLHSNSKAITDGSGAVKTGASTLKTGVKDYTEGLDTLAQGLKQLDDNSKTLNSGAGDLKSGAYSLKKGIKEYTGGVGTLEKGVKKLTKNNSKLKQGTNDLASGTKELKNNTPVLSNGVSQLDSGAKKVAEGTKQLNDNSAALVKGSTQLKDGAGQISQGSTLLAKGSDTLGKGLGTLGLGVDKLETSLKRGADKAKDTTISNKQKEMFASPVEADETQITTVDNNGSAMAAYMMCVGLWVGALAFGFVTGAERDPKKIRKNRKYTFRRLGEILIFALGSGAVLVTLLVYCNGLNPAYLLRTYFLAVMTSLAFTSIAYFMFVLLGIMGEFALLLLLVIQLGCAGGTYPLDLSPGIYSALKPLFPFSYAVDGFRMTIATGQDITNIILVLGAFTLVFAVLTAITVIIKVRTKKEKEYTMAELLEQAFA